MVMEKLGYQERNAGPAVGAGPREDDDVSSIDRGNGARWRARWRDHRTGRAGPRCSTGRGARKHASWRSSTPKSARPTSTLARGRSPSGSTPKHGGSPNPTAKPTRNAAEQQLRLHAYPTIGDRPLPLIRPSELKPWCDTSPNGSHPPRVTTTFGKVAVFGAAVRDRLVATSPCLGVKLPKKPPSTLAVLTTDQVLAFADAIAPRHRAMVLTGATTGLRPGELGGLTTGRVDFLRRTIRVDQR